MEISKAKLYAEQTLAYILNKLRKHDQIIKNLHELKGEGWRKMKYARGLFDRSVGLLSLNDVNKEYIALTEPFHCKILTSSKKLFDECSKDNKISLVSEEELFGKSDIIIIQGQANDFTCQIDKDLISKIKNEALLVLATDDIKINKDYLVETLKQGRINALVWEGFDFAETIKGLPNVMLAKQTLK